MQLATILLAVFGDLPERASLTIERALSLDGAVRDLERPRDSRYLAQLAMLAAARHARDPWRTLVAWGRLYGRHMTLAVILALLALDILLVA